MSSDYVIRATALNGKVRVFAAATTELVAKAKEIHNMSATPCVALGRTLTAAAMMSQTLKSDKDLITIQIKGDGPISGIVVITDVNANVRGYAYNPSFYFPLNEKGKFDIAGAVGKGYLNINKDVGLKEPYLGFVDLVSGEIAEDIAYYYAYSEQIPTIVMLGVLVGPEEKILNAGGLIIQLMPDADEDTIKFLEDRIAKIPPITEILREDMRVEAIIEKAFEGEEFKILNKIPTSFKCTCSRERMEKNIISLGKDEIASIINELGYAELVCHFCNTKYLFTENQLQNILENIK